MARVAIIGPGAIGGIVAACLEQVGQDVVVCARSPFEELIVETSEARIKARPHVLLSPGKIAPADWILVATKAYDLPSAMTWLPGLRSEKTRVAVLQNGVDHVERMLPYVARDRIVPVIVDIPAERLEPGHLKMRARGSLTLEANDDGRAFSDMFRGAPIDLHLTSDFRTAAWRKLAINCAGAVSALTLKPASVVNHPSAARVMRDLIRECVIVGRAEGARLDDTLVEQVLERCRSGAPDGVNSLHADRRDGRPMEIDLRHGVIVRLGQRHGIPTPVNCLVIALLEASAS